MSIAPSNEQETREEAGSTRARTPRPLPKGLIKAATISIIPWTIGSLLSPFGEPRLVLLALPLLALGGIILTVRADITVKRVWLPWSFCLLLCLTSGIRFLVLPFLSELTTASTDLDEAEVALGRTILALASLKILFYIASAGLLIFSAFALLAKQLRERRNKAH